MRTPELSPLLSFVLVALAVPAMGQTPPPTAPCWNSSASVKLTDQGCGPLQPPQISCYQPADVEGLLSQPNFNTRQRATDFYAWQQFVALNWPADPARPGQPASDKKLDAPGPRVWETWREVDGIFLSGGVDPGPWGQVPPLPRECAEPGATRLLRRTAKVDDLLDAMTQPTGANATLPPILTDQAKKPVRYEVRMNQVAYEYLRANGLYNGSVQMQAQGVSFPAGSMLMKAAWREVGEGQSGRFLTTRACVCEQGADGQPRGCRPQLVGLVGFHLMAKTASAPQWIWATFEQVDNVSSAQGAAASFNNPACGPGKCPPNHVRPLGVPTQVKRVLPIPDVKPDCSKPQQAVDDIRTLNADMACALRAARSVLASYQLIGAQWPVSSGQGDPTTVFSVLPARLGNTTLETFIQSTSSCMGCHAMARTNRPDVFASSDFTFTLNDAQPYRPLSKPALPPDERSLTGLDAQAQALVQRGFELATRTYELRPDAVGSKLHCASCHLDAGRNPTASWWVGMETYYPVDPANPNVPPGVKLQTLQERINQCFSRSMNGKPLCTPGTGQGTCASERDMNALIAYIRWVSAQYRSFEQPARGFPVLASQQGNEERGRRVFAQKCAFCHGERGQGRYQDDAYFRPALWGPNSFNAQAGMAKVEVLARFIHANMPLGSGGELTEQEAWDLATFIDARCRPGRTCDAEEADTPER